MTGIEKIRHQISENGFSIVEKIYSETEMNVISTCIDTTDQQGDTFRRSSGLFAIRQFLKTVPGISPLIFNEKMKQLIADVFGEDYFVVKSIWFDKPKGSNWYVQYHQDLTISVNTRTETEGFGPWTVKQDQFAVQPPVSILENLFTVRIHLDDTHSGNGALRVIPGSHRRGICPPATIDRKKEKEITCDVERGGVMIMKPLLLHSSSRTVSGNSRRVIHIEFSRETLPPGLAWSERQSIVNPG